MAKQDKVAWNSFTKQQLINTIKRLDERQTELLNEIATLKRQTVATSDAFPWGPKTGTMLPNPFLKVE